MLMRFRILKAAPAVLAIGCLLSIAVSAQQAPAATEPGAAQGGSQVKDGGSDRQASNTKSGDQAADGRVNVTVRPQNEEKGDTGSSTPKGWGWIPWFFSVVLSWPFLVAALAIYLLRRPQLIQSIVLHIQSFKVFGAEFILDRRSGSTAEAAIQVYRDAVKEKFDVKVESEGIADKHKKIVDKLLDGSSGTLKGANLRSTIYVPDMLLDQSLYQLLDYYPPTSDGGRKGRAFSTRYGMIGRSWRLEKSDFKGKVSTNPEDLIGEWAMTRTEAKEAALGRKSFACILLKNVNDECLGLFYMDSRPESVFDSAWTQTEKLVREEAVSNGLIVALQRVYTDLIATSARVKIDKR
jgi:hypothetical protein